MRAIVDFLGKFKEAQSKSSNQKNLCLEVVNKRVPGALELNDFELTRGGLIKLSANVGGSTRSEINLHKAQILKDLALKLGKGSPYDIH